MKAIPILKERVFVMENHIKRNPFTLKDLSIEINMYKEAIQELEFISKKIDDMKNEIDLKIKEIFK